MASYNRETSVSGGDPDGPHIKISVKAIAEHFHCPVCRCSIENAALTSCGHRFCVLCINEWVGRKHECPICRNKLHQDNVIVDKQFDELIKSIIKERKKEEKLYYQKVAEAVSDSAFVSKKANDKIISPLESTLQKHLKQTLKVHEVYHQQIIAEYQRSQARAHREKHLKAEQILRQFPHDPDNPERVSQLKKIEAEWEEKRQILTDELVRIENLLTSAYDRYLEKHLPPPDTLPVTVKLSIPDKNFVAEDVILKPSDTMDFILKKLQDIMAEQGMEVVEFPSCEELQISLLSPFAPESEEQSPDEDEGGACGGIKKGMSTEADEGLTSLVQTTLHGDCRPVLEYGLKPGSEIRVRGKIVLEGEQPKLCFSATFVKGQSKRMDYFVCKTCNGTTWICQNCIGVCHKGHDLVPHRMNHISTWPCCYCPRKKLCLISPEK